jgi:exopolysaccharide biosynthesis polyprenyl glycosylphosphotransferase
MSETTAVRDLAPKPSAGPAEHSVTAALGHRLPRLTPLFDAVVIMVSVVLAQRVHQPWWPRSAGQLTLFLVLTPLVWLSAYQLSGAYRDLPMVGAAELGRLVGATASGTIGIMAVSAWWSLPVTHASLGWLFVIALGFEAAGRSLARSISIRANRDGVTALRTAVVGTADDSHELAALLLARHEFVTVGLIELAPGAAQNDGLPVVGSLSEIEAVVRRNGVRCVYVPASAVSAGQMEALSSGCRRTGAELRICANLSGIDPSRLLVRSAEDGLTVLSVKPVRLSGTRAAIKRAFDILVGVVVLLIAAPFFGLIAAAIRLTSPGPAFYRQRRVTKDGRTFTMYKFRSMVIHPERALEGKVIDLTKPFFKLENDPRVTPIGRALRSLSIDELPQLWNVVRGDMSLVGPRPLPVEQVEANREFLAPRHEVRGGLTGLWQVSGRSDLDSEEALRIDRFYIENWSLGLDVRVMLKTFGAVFARRGAL